MTFHAPPFDTDAMLQILDYKPATNEDGMLLVDPAVWSVLVADHAAAKAHIDELEFERKQKAA